MPTLSREPRIDGDLADLTPSSEFKMPASATGPSARIGLKASFRASTLFLGVTVTDDDLEQSDQLDVTLYFPDSGTTSHGLVYRFGKDGLREAPAGFGAPAFAQRLLKSASKVTTTGYTLEIAIPARAFPRFQAVGPLNVSLCLDYTDADTTEAQPAKLTSCPTGEMPDGATRLPDELRRSLALTPPRDIEGIEAQEGGWLGYSKLHAPVWAVGDARLTAQSLTQLVAGADAVSPASVALPEVSLPELEHRPLVAILLGKNPFQKDICQAENELRMVIYLVDGRSARRVLDWPAVNCRLGRAMRVELSPEGSLEIGYTSGATHHFTWTVDHFERSELG